MAKEYFTKTCPVCSGRKLKVQNKIRAYFCPRCKTSFPKAKAKQTQEQEHTCGIHTTNAHGELEWVGNLSAFDTRETMPVTFL